MSAVSEFASGLSSGQRVSLGMGVLLIGGLCAGLYMFAYRSHMEPLYTDLADQDAAKVIAQLDEMIGDPEYKIGRPRQLFNGAGHRNVMPLDQR